MSDKIYPVYVNDELVVLSPENDVVHFLIMASTALVVAGWKIAESEGNSFIARKDDEDIRVYAVPKFYVEA